MSVRKFDDERSNQHSLFYCKRTAMLSTTAAAVQIEKATCCAAGHGDIAYLGTCRSLLSLSFLTVK